MFKTFTKFVVREMDSRNGFVPVESMADNEHFRPLCLLKRKWKDTTIFHSAPYFERTGFTLDDVLLPGEDGKSIESLLPMGDDRDSNQFTLSKVTAHQVASDLSLCLNPANTEVKGATIFSKEFSTKPRKKEIPMNLLLTLRREVNMDHPFIQQLQRTGNNLHLVTATLEASEETVYKESNKAGGGFKAKFYAAFSAQGSREEKQSIVIPKGCILAFRAKPIKVTDGIWELSFFEDLKPQVGGCSEDITLSEGPSQEKLGEVGREVKYYCEIFSELSPDLLLIVLNTIKAVMRDGNLLQEFSQKMEDLLEENDGYELKTESPDLKDLLSILRDSPRYHILQLEWGINYILDALHELMEDQLLLLLESLERKIVSQQLKLVENLLEHDLEKWKEPFRVDAELLAFPHKEEQKLTMALVELSGVQLQEDGSALPRDQPFEAVAALFVALYTLNLLSGSE